MLILIILHQDLQAFFTIFGCSSSKHRRSCHGLLLISCHRLTSRYLTQSDGDRS